MSIRHVPTTTARLAIFHPGDSLTEQVAAWSEGHAECALELSFARERPAIRRVLRRANLVVLDATADPVQAMFVLSEAVFRPGGYCVAVYSETLHEHLELHARERGAWFLFGPMPRAAWEGALAGMLRFCRRVPKRLRGPRPSRLPARSVDCGASKTTSHSY